MPNFFCVSYPYWCIYPSLYFCCAYGRSHPIERRLLIFEDIIHYMEWAPNNGSDASHKFFKRSSQTPFPIIFHLSWGALQYAGMYWASSPIYIELPCGWELLHHPNQQSSVYLFRAAAYQAIQYP